MTTICGGVREQLSAYVDGELEAADRRAVARHLASCGECRDAAEEYREIGEAMGLRAVFSGPFVRSSYMADVVSSSLTVGRSS